MEKSITYITVYRSKFQAKQLIGAELWHAAVHIAVDGKTQVWEYGRYNGVDGILIKRNGGKRNDQEMITSCQLHNPLAYSKFVTFSKNYCQGKCWGYGQTGTKTNCQYYALRVLEEFATNQCVNLMGNQILKNWKEAGTQAAKYYAQKAKTNIQTALEKIMNLIISPVQ